MNFRPELATKVLSGEKTVKQINGAYDPLAMVWRVELEVAK